MHPPAGKNLRELDARSTAPPVCRGHGRHAARSGHGLAADVSVEAAQRLWLCAQQRRVLQPDGERQPSHGAARQHHVRCHDLWTRRRAARGGSARLAGEEPPALRQPPKATRPLLHPPPLVLLRLQCRRHTCTCTRRGARCTATHRLACTPCMRSGERRRRISATAARRCDGTSWATTTRTGRRARHTRRCAFWHAAHTTPAHAPLCPSRVRLCSPMCR